MNHRIFTLLTLGIFSAWAKVRKKRYFYSHTRLDDTPFQYLGQPIPILKGRLIAATLFIITYLVAGLLFFGAMFGFGTLFGTSAASAGPANNAVFTVIVMIVIYSLYVIGQRRRQHARRGLRDLRLFQL